MKRLLEGAPKRIIVAYTFPRLDMEVSKKMNHLLKAPFCVHPKTGKARCTEPHCQALVMTQPQLIDLRVRTASMSQKLPVHCCEDLASETLALQVCVPIAADEAADFDPEAVPTVGQLLTELGATSTGQSTQKVQPWRC